MARIRSIKPEFFTHPAVTALSIPARLLFISLWTQADDKGRLYDQPTKIRGLAFGDEDPVRIDKLLSELAHPSWCDPCGRDHGHVSRYLEQGRACMQIVHFSLHQRIDKPSLSLIPEQSEIVPGSFPERSTNVRGIVPERSRNPPNRTEIGNGEGEQGTGSREQNPPTVPPAAGAASPRRSRAAVRVPPSPPANGQRPGDFDAFWAAYPRHEARQAALRAWHKLRPEGEELAAIYAAVAWQRQRGCLRPGTTPEDRNTIPLPASWLNGRRWEDEPTRAGVEATTRREATARDPDRARDTQRQEARESYRPPRSGSLSMGAILGAVVHAAASTGPGDAVPDPPPGLLADPP